MDTLSEDVLLSALGQFLNLNETCLLRGVSSYFNATFAPQNVLSRALNRTRTFKHLRHSFFDNNDNAFYDIETGIISINRFGAFDRIHLHFSLKYMLVHYDILRFIARCSLTFPEVLMHQYMHCFIEQYALQSDIL